MVAARKGLCSYRLTYRPNNHQHHVAASLRSMVQELYYEVGTIVLVLIQAPGAPLRLRSLGQGRLTPPVGRVSV